MSPYISSLSNWSQVNTLQWTYNDPSSPRNFTFGRTAFRFSDPTTRNNFTTFKLDTVKPTVSLRLSFETTQHFNVTVPVQLSAVYLLCTSVWFVFIMFICSFSSFAALLSFLFVFCHIASHLLPFCCTHSVYLLCDYVHCFCLLSLILFFLLFFGGLGLEI